MKLKNLGLYLALLFASGAAPAADPPAPASTARPAPPQSAPPAAAHMDSAAIAKAASEVGYKPRQQDGKTVYCRKASAVGTRFESTTCLTEEQVAGAVQRSNGNKETLDTLRRAELASKPDRLDQLGK